MYKKLLAITLAVGALVSIVTIRKNQNRERREQINLKVNVGMTEEQGSAYVVNRLQTLLQKSMDDSTYPIGISSRIAAMYTLIKNGSVRYTILPLHPRNLGMLAHMDYNIAEKRPTFMLFVQLIEARDRWYREHGWSEDDFRLEVSIMVAHEYVHIELQREFGPLSARANKGPSPLDAREEAAAWGITAREMFRPALAQKRRLLWEYVDKTKAFEKLGSDYNDPRWVSLFKDYHR